MVEVVLVLCVAWLAWSNGANDNFKGVATLYGSGTASYRQALTWATAATFLGSVASITLAQGLVKAFSGHGLIDVTLIDTTLLIAVAAAAAATVLLATVIGMPTSTTHALTGALVGAAMMTGASGIDWNTLGAGFAQPLLLSPLLAIGLTATIYPLLRAGRRKLGVNAHTCVCLSDTEPQPVAVERDFAVVADTDARLALEVAETDQCVQRYGGKVAGVEAQAAVDSLHYLSGAAVCFARAVNDTPKIAAILLAGSVSGTSTVAALSIVTAAVVIGGIVQSRKVAQTMSRRITDLNTGQGLVANLVTAGLVMGASTVAVPVSTTHVSCGAIFAIGAVNGRRQWGTIMQILATWLTTLPLGLALGAAAYALLQSAGW